MFNLTILKKSELIDVILNTQSKDQQFKQKALNQLVKNVKRDEKDGGARNTFNDLKEKLNSAYGHNNPFSALLLEKTK